MDKKYMGGRGVLRKTEELQAETWEHLGMAILSVIPWTFSFLSLVAAFATQMWPFVLVSAALAFVAYKMSAPHGNAIRALREHTEKMKMETSKRGKGWAND